VVGAGAPVEVDQPGRLITAQESVQAEHDVEVQITQDTGCRPPWRPFRLNGSRPVGRLDPSSTLRNQDPLRINVLGATRRDVALPYGSARRRGVGRLSR
jgi:hypothetical protein